MANTDLVQIKGRPGIFKMRLPQGTSKIVKLVEWREDYIFDTVDYVTGATVPLGNQQVFFQNVAGKQLVDCNISTPRKLQAGQEMVLNQIGVMPLHHDPHAAAGEVVAVDFCWAVDRLHYELFINGISIAQGPVHCFPPGLGMTGSTAGLSAVLTNGVASPAAVPRLLVPQTITEQSNTFEGRLTHFAAAWTAAAYAGANLASGMLIRNTLRGYVTVAVGKG